MAAETVKNKENAGGEQRQGFMSRLKNIFGDKKNITLLILFLVFLAAFFIPFDNPKVVSALNEAFAMLGEYAREHVILCLVPAFFIAGAIMVFLNQQAVIKYLGPDAPKLVAYSVASVSGAILAVCSCTVLPLFKGIYRKGAGIGPAVAFLYSGPAINILAIVLTAKVLGLSLGIARAVGAVFFALIIGFIMHLIFHKEDAERVTNSAMFAAASAEEGRSLGKTTVHLFSLVGILVFVNWAPSRGAFNIWDILYKWKYLITGLFGLVLVYSIVKWFRKEELVHWVKTTRDFSLQILPLLFGGVLVAGFLLGRPGREALIPETWIAGLLGGNSFLANLTAGISGALMYFATLTEVPIMQGLLGAGMGQGPALALLLAGPSMSLPSLLVGGRELGLKKTLVYTILVVILSALTGMFYGFISS